MNQTDHPTFLRRGMPLVVDFSICRWIATTSNCVTSPHDSSLQGNLSHFHMAMLARALRFI